MRRLILFMFIPYLLISCNQNVSEKDKEAMAEQAYRTLNKLYINADDFIPSDTKFECFKAIKINYDEIKNSQYEIWFHYKMDVGEDLVWLVGEACFDKEKNLCQIGENYFIRVTNLMINYESQSFDCDNIYILPQLENCWFLDYLQTLN